MTVSSEILADAKVFAKRTILYDVVTLIRQLRALRVWRDGGELGPPPPVVKQRAVREYARRFSVGTLVETGTFLGEMVFSMRNSFRSIYSIELDRHLWKLASERFKTYKHISIIQGDSAEMLPELLSAISERCIFWLDGHYSEGITARGNKQTPIMEEIEHILEHRIKDHVILIDDARCFTGQDDYPTIEELEHQLFKARPCWRFEVKNDIIRFTEAL